MIGKFHIVYTGGSLDIVDRDAGIVLLPLDESYKTAKELKITPQLIKYHPEFENYRNMVDIKGREKMQVEFYSILKKYLLKNILHLI